MRHAARNRANWLSMSDTLGVVAFLTGSDTAKAFDLGLAGEARFVGLGFFAVRLASLAMGFPFSTQQLTRANVPDKFGRVESRLTSSQRVHPFGEWVIDFVRDSNLVVCMD